MSLLTWSKFGMLSTVVFSEPEEAHLVGVTIAMTDEARTATNQLSILVHLPCASTTSIRPINADAIRTEIIIATSLVGRHQWTTPKWGRL
jgi:hypothetical protein